MTKAKFVPVQKFSAEQVARTMRVPYWLIDASLPKPSWFRRPIWRFRATIWARTSRSI